MSLRTTFFSILAVLTLTSPGFAADSIVIHDGYIRSTTPTSRTGAAFMVLMNHGDSDDRLIGARSDVAKRVEIHTHIENDDGVMQMGEIEDGILLLTGEMHSLQRGGDHLMFMGLTKDLIQGETVKIILIFENAGDVSIEIPVDRDRKPGKTMHKHSDG